MHLRIIGILSMRCIIWLCTLSKLLGMVTYMRLATLGSMCEAEDIGSRVSDNQFMIHALNNVTSDYDLQLP